jgi:hypothetical protein
MGEELTIAFVREEIKKNIKKCIERYALHNDRFLKDLEGDVILIVEEGFSKLKDYRED